MISMNQHNMKNSALLKYDNNCFGYEMYENKSLKIIVNRQYLIVNMNGLHEFEYLNK
jgi:hypothetical protein